ncbi:MAG: hypothetical protein Q8914_14145, partial [Bacteroidota bacterium]|nr:hypothetical protein [Bacteroidota bacterium]
MPVDYRNGAPCLYPESVKYLNSWWSVAGLYWLFVNFSPENSARIYALRNPALTGPFIMTIRQITASFFLLFLLFTEHTGNELFARSSIAYSKTAQTTDTIPPRTYTDHTPGEAGLNPVTLARIGLIV